MANWIMKDYKEVGTCVIDSKVVKEGRLKSLNWLIITTQQ